MTISAVIFDMDGTLVDSREIILGAYRHVLEELGQDYDESEVSSHVGRPLGAVYESLMPTHDNQQYLLELHRSWQQDNAHLLKGYEGLDEFLKELKQNGYKLAIFTSAGRSRTELALKGLGVFELFDHIISADDVSEPKPHKEGVVSLAKLMETPLNEVVMIGDAEHDIASGKNAGVITIGVTHGFGTKDSLKRAGADYIADNLKGIKNALIGIANNET